MVELGGLEKWKFLAEGMELVALSDEQHVENWQKICAEQFNFSSARAAAKKKQ